MNASRPKAETEYSTPHQAPDGDRAAWQRRYVHYRATVLAAGAVGAAVLISAEFTTLLTIHTVDAHPQLVRAVQTGPHHGWALLPIAVLALVLTLYVLRSGSRLGLGAIAVLGAAVLLVALAVDLPDVHGTGLVGTPATGLRNAQAHVALGLYLETLGGVVLLVEAAAGALLEPTAGRRRKGKETRGLPTARDRGLR